MDEDGISEKWFQGLRGNWKKRTYEKLNGSSRRRVAQVETGSTRNTRRRFWRIKIAPKQLRFFRKFPLPKKLLVRLRDAYVNMMANSAAFSGGYDCIDGFGKRPAKEYDDKKIIEIYKSMVVSQRQLVHRPAATAGLEPKLILFR